MTTKLPWAQNLRKPNAQNGIYMRYRMTKNKRLILEALAPVHDRYLYSEVLQAPYSPKQLQFKLEYLDMGTFDLSNLIRTLRVMEKQGLVVRDKGLVSVDYNFGNKNDGDYNRDTVVWWRGAEFYKQDKEFVKQKKEEIDKGFYELLERMVKA